MKAFISLCLILLIALSNSQYLPISFSSCSESTNPVWRPRSVEAMPDPDIKENVFISANGFVNNLGYYVDFQTLLVNGTIGDAYAWNFTIPYFHRVVGYGKYLALNYTAYFPYANEKYVNISMQALGPNGNELGCVKMTLVNQTAISI